MWIISSKSVEGALSVASSRHIVSAKKQFKDHSRIEKQFTALVGSATWDFLNNVGVPLTALNKKLIDMFIEQHIKHAS